jgi:hypothetical protein
MSSPIKVQRETESDLAAVNADSAITKQRLQSLKKESEE